MAILLEARDVAVTPQCGGLHAVRVRVAKLMPSGRVTQKLLRSYMTSRVLVHTLQWKGVSHHNLIAKHLLLERIACVALIIRIHVANPLVGKLLK